MGYGLWGNKGEGCTQGATLSLLIVQGSQLIAQSSHLNHLTPEVRGHIGDMYPSSIALPYQLRETHLSLLLHLPYEVEQTTMVGLVARNDICSAAQQVVTVLHASDERIELLAAVATGHHYRLTPRLAYRVEKLVHKYV